MIIILLFLIVIYFFKPTKNTNIFNKNIIKKKVKLKGLALVKSLFFCEKNYEYTIVNNIEKNSVTFNNLSVVKKSITALKNAGLNILLPIYKLEFYVKDFQKNEQKISITKKNAKKSLIKNNQFILKGKDFFYRHSNANESQNKNNFVSIRYKLLQDIYKYLHAIKLLQNKNIFANFLMFLDEDKLYKDVKKLIDYFGVKVKIYIKNEIDYKLLGAINSLNVNTTTNITCNKKDINIKNKLSNLLLQENNYSQITNQKIENNKFIITVLNQNFEFNSFDYYNYYMESKIENKMFFAKLKCTFNFNQNALIYKLKITNATNKNLDINFNYLSVMPLKKPQNPVYFACSSKLHVYLCNIINTEKSNFLVGKFSLMQSKTNKIFANKIINLKPYSSEEFYFLSSANEQNELVNLDYFLNELSSKQHLKNYINYLSMNLKNLYENNNYSKLKLLKILTPNKTLNTIINNYLPQRIIKNFLINNFYYSLGLINDITISNNDFNNLKNNVFSIHLVDNYFDVQNINSVFLIKNNLYKTYLNFIYFKLGFFASNSGLNINPDKRLVEQNAIVSLKQFKNDVTINMTKTDLKNEIKIDNIKYTNLKFLNITQKVKNLHLQF